MTSEIKKNKNILIAPMNDNTVEDVAEIEQECFFEPWSLNGLKSELVNPLAVFYTARIGGVTAGYAGMHNVAGCGYITNIAVSERYRRQGVAGALLNALLAFGRENKLEMITLEVRPSNNAAIKLYTRFGFKEEGRRVNFYRNPLEDALILTTYI